MDEGEDDVSAKIFVGGLQPATTDESLAAHFANFAPVESAVMMDKLTGRSRGFGFVVFPNVALAQAALSEAHHVDGKAVECKACVSRVAARQAGMGPRDLPPPGGRSFAAPGPGLAAELHGQQGAAAAGNKVFVGGLAPATTAESMSAYFSQFGTVDCVVMMDKLTGRSRGFGFATFASPEEAQLVLSCGSHLLNGSNAQEAEHLVDGKVVSVRRCDDRAPPLAPPRAETNFGTSAASAPPRTASRGYYGRPRPDAAAAGGGGTAAAQLTSALEALQQSLGALSAATDARARPPAAAAAVPPRCGSVSGRIFCGGLPQTCSDDVLHGYFSNFGTVTDAKVMMDRATSRSRGFGYVSFADAAACEAVLSFGQHTIHERLIEVKPCEEKGSPSLQGAGGGGAPAPRVVRPPAAAAALSQPVPQPTPLWQAAAPETPVGSEAPAAPARAAALGHVLAALGPALGAPQSSPDAAALPAQLATMLQGLESTGGGQEVLSHVTRVLQDPQTLLQTILAPVAPQLAAAGQGVGGGGGARFSPY